MDSFPPYMQSQCYCVGVNLRNRHQNDWTNDVKHILLNKLLYYRDHGMHNDKFDVFIITFKTWQIVQGHHTFKCVMLLKIKFIILLRTKMFH